MDNKLALRVFSSQRLNLIQFGPAFFAALSLNHIAHPAFFWSLCGWNANQVGTVHNAKVHSCNNHPGVQTLVIEDFDFGPICVQSTSSDVHLCKYIHHGNK